MVLSGGDAIFDEPVVGAVPTTGELGRQVKRLKTSTILNDVVETLPMVTEEVIGARFARAADMAAEMAVNYPRHRQLLNAIAAATQQAIAHSCVPGGAMAIAMRQVVDDSCVPGGAIWNLLSTACQPGGIVDASVVAAEQRTMAHVDASVVAAEQRTMARMHNATVHDAAGGLQPLPDVQRRIPNVFPASYEGFATMTVACADSLLLAYGLPLEGTPLEKVKRLSAYCNVNLPK